MIGQVCGGESPWPTGVGALKWQWLPAALGTRTFLGQFFFLKLGLPSKFFFQELAEKLRSKKYGVG